MEKTVTVMRGRMRVRDLHQDDAGAPLGGDHRPASCGASTASASGSSSDWTPGSRYEARAPRPGSTIAEGENLEVDPPRRLVQSFTALWSDEVKSEGTSRVTWEIEPVGDSCRLTVTHDQLREGANDELYGGWPMILSGLKTLLETGELLDHARLAALRRSERLAQLSKPSPSAVERPQPQARAGRLAGRRRASRLRVSSIAAQRSGSGGNGSGFDRIARERGRLGGAPVEQVECDAGAEAAGADAEPGVPDRVGDAASERGALRRRRSGCTCRSRRPSGG